MVPDESCLWHLHLCAVSSHSGARLDHVTSFGQLGINKGNSSRGLIDACTW